jgi:hypothetical protein
MSNIPIFSYKQYLNDMSRLTQTGTIDAGQQAEAPISAGARGLKKTKAFIDEPVHMMGESITMEDMKSLINRIDGLNVPTNEINELADDDKMEFTKVMLDLSVMKDRINALTIDEDAKASAIQSLTQAEESLVALDETAVQEDLDYRSDDILNKAGFDPMKVKEYMAVFNDHGDTSDIDQMNMDKVGLADAMSMVLASHDIKNESYQPFPEVDEMTFEDDDEFYEAFGELGFPEDETELFDAEYRGRKVPLNKPMRGDVKKFKVYVKDPKSGNVKKVNFGHGGSSARKAGQKTMKIRKSNPKARKSFRARHNCANPGPKTRARYWSCRAW